MQWVDPLGLACKLGDCNSLEEINAKYTDPQPDGFSSGKVTISDNRVLIDGKPANGTYDYVITSNGELRLGGGHYYLSGEAGSVRGAGGAYFEGGRVSVLTDGSGHYRPTIPQVQNIANTFRDNGLLTDDFFIQSLR